MELKVKRLAENAKLPTRGSADAAGYDLYADLSNENTFIDNKGNVTLSIMEHETKPISTGIAIAIPKGYFGAIYARSGLATKRGLRPANCTGVIDADYRGPIIVALHNDTELPQCIEDGERIAQLIISPYQEVNMIEVNELDDTERGEGGFGSTGVK